MLLLKKLRKQEESLLRITIQLKREIALLKLQLQLLEESMF